MTTMLLLRYKYLSDKMSIHSDEAISALAKQMLLDYDAHNPGTPFADGLNLELSDAWRLQTAVADLREARGESVVGYKIGCVCETNQKRLGLSHPVWGRLWSSEQHSNGVILKKEDYANVAFETEFAVRLSRSIDPSDTSAEAIAQSVEEIFPVIEIHNLVRRSAAPNGGELIANNCIHAGVVRGTGVKAATMELNTDLALIYDGQTVDSWASLKWPDDILSAMRWLLEQLSQQDKQLKAGGLILTGAFGPPIPLGENTQVDVTSSGFGNVSASFV